MSATVAAPAPRKPLARFRAACLRAYEIPAGRVRDAALSRARAAVIWELRDRGRGGYARVLKNMPRIQRVLDRAQEQCRPPALFDGQGRR